MTGSQTDETGLLSDIPPADERKSLADFLAPRPSSRPPSLTDFLRPSRVPKTAAPPRESVPAKAPAADTIDTIIEVPEPRPSLFSELPVPRSPRLSAIPGPPPLPGHSDHRLDPDDQLTPAHPVESDDAELDAELTSTRRWLEARRSSQTGPQLPSAESPTRHTAEPVWNADLPQVEPDVLPTDKQEDAEEVAGLDSPRTPAGRRTLAISIVVGAALLTLLVRLGLGHRRPVERSLAVVPALATATTIVDDGIPAPGPVTAAPIDVVALRREARQLLSAGHVQEGVQIARQLIEIDPRDSEAYILLAAGLQDLGRWREAGELFAKCAHLASGADTAECVYFARFTQ